MQNRLAGEKSPYLLQHADNPVDWRPWGPEALEEAVAEDKPIFLSIGYATCHWCHVMAHESFEDEEVARELNANFIPIKVDREERPDLDGVYMTVCQALTGRGGWPLSVWLTPEGKPFLAGTYFPKNSRGGMSGFLDILREVARRWKGAERAKIAAAGEEITRSLAAQPGGEGTAPGMGTMEAAYEQLRRSYDFQHGGFGRAPKFPTPHQLSFLLRWHLRRTHSEALDMALHTLDSMHRGGMFDQVGFGFHRYSVDERWLVPHFEKMLYDQAMLAMAYLEAYQVSGLTALARAAREIFTYVLRDLTSPEGGFYSAEDADSEGVEGRFYVWTPEEAKAVLGEEMGGLWCRYYGVAPGGNFEHGWSIPHLTRDPESFGRAEGIAPDDLAARLEEARQRLFAAREKRPRPLLDDKVLTSWNGLMIAALALGSRVLGEPLYLEKARAAAGFIAGNLLDGEGRPLRRWREGQAAGKGFLDDHVFLAWGLIELYQTGFDPAHLREALRLMDLADRHFWDAGGGAYFFTPEDGEDLIFREKEFYDGALPSANSVAALNLLRLGRLAGRPELEERASRLMSALGTEISRHPMAHTQMLLAVDFLEGPGREIVFSGPREDPEMAAMIQKAHRAFLPRTVMLHRGPGGGGPEVESAPFLKDMPPIGGRPTAYVCRDFACQAPVTDASALVLE